MNNETKGYNGWTNYETWCVHLWLTNEEMSYRYWREEAARHRKESRTNSNVIEGVWSVELAERAGFASQLKDEIEGASPIEEASLFSDLLNAALSEVDWLEIADAFLEDVEPEDSESNESSLVEDFEIEKQERIEKQKTPLFELGRTVCTPDALATLGSRDIEEALTKHQRGDWGCVGREDWAENETSLKEGFRLFSVYCSESGEKFWVITEADRSSTCVLLPENY